MGQGLVLSFAPELRLFLRPRDRAGTVRVAVDGTSSLGHLVEAAGVPLTEVGGLRVGGLPAEPSHRPRDGEEAEVLAVRRPQDVPPPVRFLLDVHLGTLARRLRLVGLDTSYSPDMDDDELLELANAEHRVLLTRDRGLLRRHALWFGAHVDSDDPDTQFTDVLDRFAPPLAPWTRCPSCNAPLSPVGKPEIRHLLAPGTDRTQQTFARCPSCAQLYWRGAHRDHLEDLVDRACRTVAGRRPA